MRYARDSTSCATSTGCTTNQSSNHTTQLLPCSTTLVPSSVPSSISILQLLSKLGLRQCFRILRCLIRFIHFFVVVALDASCASVRLPLPCNSYASTKNGSLPSTTIRITGPCLVLDITGAIPT